MDTTLFIGLGAGFLTTAAFVPQAWRIWKTKAARDISLPAFIAFTAGVALWLVYGIVKEEPAIIVWNAATLVIAAVILAMKIRYG